MYPSGLALRGLQEFSLFLLISLDGQPARLTQSPQQEKFLKARGIPRLIIGSLDVLVVPGGPYVDELFDDQVTIQFLQNQGAKAKYITSICTGSLILGAAGLLKGYQATTHWASLGDLTSFGASVNTGRVVVDRNRITGGGVTAGIDFAFTLVAELINEEMAKMLQLGLEYNPAPPFDSGHPSVADPVIVAMVTEGMKDRLERRTERSRCFESSI